MKHSKIWYGVRVDNDKEFSTVGVFGKRDFLDYEPLRIIAELLIKSGRQVLLEKKPAEALRSEKVSPVTKSAKNPTSLSFTAATEPS